MTSPRRRLRLALVYAGLTFFLVIALSPEQGGVIHRPPLVPNLSASIAAWRFLLAIPEAWRGRIAGLPKAWRRKDGSYRVAAKAPERGAVEVQGGKMVAELKPSGYDKGSAIGEFMREPPFAGRVPLFIGDDATDEHGFEVVNRLGGHSVKVGEGPSAARWRLAAPAAVRAWLTEGLAHAAGR